MKSIRTLFLFAALSLSAKAYGQLTTATFLPETVTGSSFVLNLQGSENAAPTPHGFIVRVDSSSQSTFAKVIFDPTEDTHNIFVPLGCIWNQASLERLATETYKLRACVITPGRVMLKVSTAPNTQGGCYPLKNQ